MIDPVKLIEKYYTKDSDIYKLLLAHSIQVRNKALEVLIVHPEIKVDIDFIKEAAMLHDIGMIKCYAPKIHCYGEHKYIEHGYLGAEMLRDEGLYKHALVCERHTGAGISKETIIKHELPIPHREMIPISTEEQLICYADKFYSKSRPENRLTVDTIIKDLSKHGEDQVLTFKKWHKLFD